MKYLKLGEESYPFKTSFLAISRVCSKFGKSFNEIGDLLSSDTIEVLYAIIADGLSRGTKEEWTIERIDDIVGVDSVLIGELSEFLAEVLGVEKNEIAPEG